MKQIQIIFWANNIIDIMNVADTKSLDSNYVGFTLLLTWNILVYFTTVIVCFVYYSLLL